MDAVNYIKSRNRMCANYLAMEGHCENCELYKEGAYSGICTPCAKGIPQAEKAVEIIEKWAKAKPAKTRQSKFLELYPNAELDGNNLIMIAPCQVDDSVREENRHCRDCYCDKCRRDYWMQEVEE